MFPAGLVEHVWPGFRKAKAYQRLPGVVPLEKLTLSEYLSQVRTINYMIKRKKQRLDELEYKIRNPSGNWYGVKVQGTKDPHKMESMIVKADELRLEIMEDLLQEHELHLELIRLISQLQNVDHVQILIQRYVFLEPWDKIAKETGKNRCYLHEMKRKALAELETIYNEMQL